MTETPENPPRRSRGRPRDPMLRDRILGAAQAEFLANGLEAVRMEDIAVRAGTSKMTIYQHFASKMVLFHEVQNRLLITSLPQPSQFAPGAAPDEVLFVIAKHYIQAVTAVSTIQQLHLLCQPQAQDLPAAAAFFDSGPQAAVRQLAAVLHHYCEQGVLLVPCSITAAEQFLAMVRGNEHMRALLALPPGRDDSALDTYIASCVDLLLRAFRPARRHDNRV